MTEVALTPAQMDMTFKKLVLTPKNLGQGITPKFQSRNQALLGGFSLIKRLNFVWFSVKQYKPHTEKILIYIGL